MKQETGLEKIAERIKRAERVVLFTHIRPDGDAIGSAFALKTALEQLNIPSVYCNESAMPSNLSFLPDLGEIKSELPSEKADLYIALDNGDSSRLGVFADKFLGASRKKIDTINIDHHVSNNRYADYNYVRVCSSNCMNVATLIDLLGVPYTKKIAEYLLTGLLTDSGNFSHDDVTEECFLLSARLIKAGAEISRLSYNLFKKQPKARAKLYAEVMGKMRFFHSDKFALITISLEQMERYGADNGMTEGFVDFPLNVDTVEIAASVMEVKKGQYKISLRSKTYADVNKLAGVYGGGGHVRASGCMLYGDLEEIIDKLSYTVSQYLEF
ncbi:MAG: bifunctional oligoribonuclease/PAP phosphatase NrnA [Clostridiales bacterium]|nr:bifunctional oligoribonuclease/PAP phosphatase NrnA [Clostridiales bacterium]